MLLSSQIQADINVLHHFTPGNIHGGNPVGDLITDGIYLYGMTSGLGQYNCGTIFRLNSDGSSYLLLHTFAGGGANRSVTFSNVLQTIDALDSGAFAYYGTGGALELITQDGSHLIQAALKSYNGNVTRTVPAFRDVEANTAAIGRDLMIPNISNDTVRITVTSGSGRVLATGQSASNVCNDPAAHIAVQGQ